MFNFIFSFLVFVFGLIVGSFLNCVIYRLETKQSFIKGRSFCPHCRHLLGFQDLIPVLSFFILKGKCRYCQKKISWQYPLIEIATGIIFLLIFGNFEFGIYLKFGVLNLLFYLIISCLLIIIFVYDLKHYLIPDQIVYLIIVLTLIFNFQFLISKQFAVFNNSLFSALAAAFFFLFIFLVSRGQWLGLGDVKLAFFLGLFLGFPKVLVALYLAFFIGALVGLGLIIAGRKTLKSAIPFGPFLILGFYLTWFWGDLLIAWYKYFFMLE